MTNLIGFDKNRNNLEFKGPCKLSVNFMSNYLYVEPKNEEFKLISASFEWNYVMKKNLLFVFAQFDFLDFCLEFKDEQMCKKILDYIESEKKNHEMTDSISIDESFINPIFQKIADNLPLNSDLINVMANWHQLLDEKDKEKYSNMMKEYGIYDPIISAIQNQVIHSENLNLVETNLRKRRFSQVKKEEIDQDESENKTAVKPSKRFFKIIPSTQYQLIHIPRDRFRTMLIFTSDQMDSFHQFKSSLSKDDKFKCFKCDHKAIIDVNEGGEFLVKMESKKHSCKPSKESAHHFANIRVIQKPDYIYFDNCSRKIKKVLVIFDSVDRSLCYEYYWSDSALKFYCRGCSYKKIPNSNVSKANVRNEGTEKEYVEHFGEHQCEKRKYNPERFHQYFDCVFKPYFEIQTICRGGGNEIRRLYIFDASDRTKYYQYYCLSKTKKFICCGCEKTKFVTATLNKNSEDVEYLTLSKVKHVCEMRSSDTIEYIILHRPQDFEMMKEKIFIFANNDQKCGYMFYKKAGSYSCVGCNSKCKKDDQRVSIVKGKLLKDEETGEYSFQMKSNQTHICEPRPYQPEKYEDIPKTSDFFYYRLKKEPTTVKVAIHSPENNHLCFTFVHQKLRNNFKCIECKRRKKTYSVKCQKDFNGKEYFEHDLKKHVCQPVKVSSISKSEILKESGIKMESKPKIDESKIIKSPNFELRPNRNGGPDRKLIVFLSTEKILSYEFSFHIIHNLFYCNKCSVKKACVSAKLHKNDDEESFIVMGKNQHVCEPIKYQPLYYHLFNAFK